MLRSKRRFLIDRVKKATAGVCGTLADVVLGELAVFAIALSDTRAAHNYQRLDRLSSDLRDSWDERQLLTAIRKLREKGWISQELTPTQEGQKRLREFIPGIQTKRRWSGKWYIVTFDVPERERGKRDRFRSVLRALGYVPLHQSVWLASENFFGDVKAYIKEEGMTAYVIFSVSEALGTEGSRTLADRLWDLKALNQRYRSWVKQCEKSDRPTIALYWEYSSILQDDPQLPLEILPRSWYGTEAHEIFSRHFSNVFA